MNFKYSVYELNWYYYVLSTHGNKRDQLYVPIAFSKKMDFIHKSRIHLFYSTYFDKCKNKIISYE